jgi:hypothetical protein
MSTQGFKYMELRRSMESTRGWEIHWKIDSLNRTGLIFKKNQDL